MVKDTSKHLYATLSIPGSKKFSVCARRLGTRERMVVIANCTEEGTAEKIVDALNLLQGKLETLEVPAQRVLEEVRSALGHERAKATTLAREKGELEIRLQGLKGELAIANRDHERTKRDLEITQHERDALQQKITALV